MGLLWGVREMTAVKGLMLKCSARGQSLPEMGLREEGGLLTAGRLGVRPGSHLVPGDPGVVSSWTRPQWEFTGYPALARL